MGPQAKHKNQPNRWAHRQNTKTNRTDLRERKIQNPKLQKTRDTAGTFSIKAPSV
jgi:hypothetical protein